MECYSTEIPSNSQPRNTEPERRRRRPPVSCTLCRKRKTRCDRGNPCRNCLRSRGGQCVYEQLSPPRPRGRTAQPAQPPSEERTSSVPVEPAPDVNKSTTSLIPSRPSMSTVGTTTDPPTPASHVSTIEVESLRSRVKQLEEQLTAARISRSSIISSAPSPNVDIRTTTSHIAGTFHQQQEVPLSDNAPVISRNIMHKTRLFGQSHCMNGFAQFLDILEMIEPFVQNESSQMFRDLQRCKYLGKVIKAQRRPPWPTVPTTDLPPKELADTLVDTYLRTTESVYRTLHLPIFRRDYENIWGINSSPDMALVIQIKLVMAIGAAMHDDTFSLRASAIRWIYEAQAWVSEPNFKHRLNMQFLQVNILLLIAREIVGVSGSMTWVAAGQLIRTAVYMGFHRDPMYLPKQTTFVSEMRRRLWNTILEIALQTSMESGGPPLLTPGDFDTQPPGNFDDEQILTEDPVPRPEEVFTQTSLALALRRMFPLRLAIAQSLNGISAQISYEETLRMDSELRKIYRTICQPLQGKSKSNASPSQFQICLLDYVMRRYLLALHTPYFGLSLQEASYAFSRQVVIDASVRIRALLYPTASITSTASSSESISPDRDDLARLAKCGASLFRMIGTQTCFLIAAELKAQLQEGDSLGPVPLRQDLLSVLGEAKRWSLQCINAGESNCKGYLFISMISAQITGLSRGLAKEELSEHIAKAGQSAEAQILALMEEKVAESQPVDSSDGTGDVSIENIPDIMEDWDFMMPDTHFYFGDPDPMNWVNTAF